eukprot:scaffold761_cov137-Skeletonema_menzelii.AAC.6
MTSYTYFFKTRPNQSCCSGPLWYKHRTCKDTYKGEDLYFLPSSSSIIGSSIHTSLTGNSSSRKLSIPSMPPYLSRGAQIGICPDVS